MLAKKMKDCFSSKSIGFCRYRAFCDDAHEETVLPRCLILYHIYPDPKIFNLFLNEEDQINIPPENNAIFFDDFYLDIFTRMSKYGKVDNLLISGDTSFDLTGNAYVLFHEVDTAFIAYSHLVGKCFYAGRKISIELAPISQLSLLKCREMEKKGNCDVQNCPYIHSITPSPAVYSKCFPSTLIIYPNKLSPLKSQDQEEIQIQHLYFTQ